MSDQPSPTPRRSLSREAVVDTAISIADQDGLGAVSMRRVAGQLGVTAMSLYHYFTNKDGMIEAMLDQVIAEIDLPEDEDWKQAIKTSSMSSKEALLRHSWAAEIWLTQQGGVGPERLRHSDWLLATLRLGDLPEHAVFHAFHILESYILGSTLQQLGFPFEDEELEAIAGDFLDQLPVEDYPDFAQHVKQHLSPPEGPKSGFEFALDLLLDGLERLRSV